MIKKFIPCIYLKDGNVIKSFQDSTVISLNPVEIARFYSDNDADEIIVFDMSKGDEEHEKALGIIKKIVLESEVPVIGAGNIKRMEDVKKLLYAGCKKAVLNFSKSENADILEEVSLKFGRDKILASYYDSEVLKENKKVIEKYVSELICINEQNQDESTNHFTSHEVKESQDLIDLPIIAMVPNVSLDKMLDLFALPKVSGLTGEVINGSVKEISTLKAFCLERNIPVNVMLGNLKWEDFKSNSDGMVPVIVQDYKTDEVLMLAYMDKEAYEYTLKTGKMTYFSRSRNELWIKGNTSGHFQYVKALTADCDKDTILAKVSQTGAACHTGSRSCFFNEIAKKEYNETNPLKVFEDVTNVIKDRKIHPKEGSYTNYLFDKGIDKILKKLGEEATEIVIAAKNPNADEIKYEISDFLYHMMVLMVEKGVTWEEIMTELAQR